MQIASLWTLFNNHPKPHENLSKNRIGCYAGLTMPNYRTKRRLSFLSVTALLSAGLAVIPSAFVKADGAGLLPLDLNSASIAEGLPPPPPPPSPAPVQEMPSEQQAKPATADSANLLSLDLNQDSISEGLPQPVPQAPAPAKAEGTDKLQLDLDSTSIAEGLPKPVPQAPAPVAQAAPATVDGANLLSLDLNQDSISEGLPKPAPVAQTAPVKAEGSEKLQLDLDSASITEGLPKPVQPKPVAAQAAPAPVPTPAPAKAEGADKLQLDLDSASIAEGLAPPPAPKTVAAAEKPSAAPNLAEPSPNVTSPAQQATQEKASESTQPVVLPQPVQESQPVQPAVAVPQPAQPSQAAVPPIQPMPAPVVAAAAPVASAPPTPASPAIIAAVPQPMPTPAPTPAPKAAVNVMPPAPTYATPPRPAPRPTPRNASNDAFETMRQQGSQSPYTVSVPEPRPMASNTTPPIQTLRSPNRTRSESWDNFMSESRQQGAVPNKAPEAPVTPVPQPVQPVAPVAKSTLAPVTPGLQNQTPNVIAAPAPVVSNIAPTPLTEEQSTYPKLSSQDSRPQAQLSVQDRENLRQQLESERVESNKFAGQAAPAAPAVAPVSAPKKMPSASLEDVYQQQLMASSSTVTTLTAGVERDRVLVPKRVDNGAESANDTAGNAAPPSAMAANSPNKDTKIITSASLPMQSSSLSRVDFDRKSTVISTQAKAQLREVYRAYQQNNTEIEVIGLYQPKDTDAPRVISGGTKNSGDTDNAGLAARQAEAVSAHLLQLGVPMQSVNIIVRAADAGQGDGAGSWVEIQRGSAN
jgi:outer membrane protein OmpA-like peptidoglycan-associated protein